MVNIIEIHDRLEGRQFISPECRRWKIFPWAKDVELGRWQTALSSQCIFPKVQRRIQSEWVRAWNEKQQRKTLWQHLLEHSRPLQAKMVQLSCGQNAAFWICMVVVLLIVNEWIWKEPCCCQRGASLLIASASIFCFRSWSVTLGETSGGFNLPYSTQIHFLQFCTRNIRSRPLVITQIFEARQEKSLPACRNRNNASRCW